MSNPVTGHVLVPSDGEQLAGRGWHSSGCRGMPRNPARGSAQPPAQAVSVLGPRLLRGWGGTGVSWEHAGKGWGQEDLACLSLWAEAQL